MPLAANTYDSLVTDITRYADNSSASFIAEIPRFIANAQQSIGLDLKTITNRIIQESTLTANLPRLPKPANYRNMSTMSILVNGSLIPIRSASYGYCTLFWPNTSMVAQPQFICELNQDTLFLAPTPDQAYQFLMVYYF